MNTGQRTILVALLLLLSSVLQAAHIAGGEMSYKYLGPGTGNNLKYQITLKLYKACNIGALLDPRASITIYAGGTTAPFLDLDIVISRIDTIQLKSPGKCIEAPPAICYEIGYYIQEVELPVNTMGYAISYQRCCRINNITNVINSGYDGATYTAAIPGTDLGADAMSNSSPVIVTNDTVIICENNYFEYPFGATDPDNDDLSYRFDDAYKGGDTLDIAPETAAPPPYSSLLYRSPFRSSNPMGDLVSINPKTGLVSGIAPGAGIYVITVTVVETRNGRVINRHRKDIHIKVATCTIAAADLEPAYVSCNSYQVMFRNRVTSNLINSFHWDFGLPGNTDTSNEEIPVFNFPDTGTYKVMLIINRRQNCSDTAYTMARVYPGFSPKFSMPEGCPAVPLQFRDESTTRYGSVNFWKWTFGHPAGNPDTSRLQHPRYIYPTVGSFPVQLVVGTNLGCLDTLEQTVHIRSKPLIRLTRDTLICNIDTLKLEAQGQGQFSWTPNYMISSTTVPDPLVSPDLPTRYYVTLTSAPGCTNMDSVFVNVKQFVTVHAGADTTICLSDSLKLNAVSDGLQFQWTPSATLINPNTRNPLAIPTVPITTYRVTANIGKCQSTDDITVRTVPYPLAIASPDTAICRGDTARLQASGGSTYRWMPSASLSDNRSSSPLAFPTVTTRYTVMVFDNKGCPKAGIDSLVVQVKPLPNAFAGNDTAIVIGQPLQLQATGGTQYRWSPPNNLSDPNIPNPRASLTKDSRFVVTVTRNGCTDRDTINIRVFSTLPDIFVPTAFTPNNDKLNDQLIPIPVGITSLDFFRVYNRFGELIFSTNKMGKGWDGRIQGKEQNTGSYAWYVQGTDFTGKRIFKKGTSTLIR